MIKGPLMKLATTEPNASYITFNKGGVYIPEEIKISLLALMRIFRWLWKWSWEKGERKDFALPFQSSKLNRTFPSIPRHCSINDSTS
jgi:hypothetical protein